MNIFPRVLIVLALIAAVGVVALWAGKSLNRSASSTRSLVQAGAQVDAPTLADERPRDYEGLHNVVAFHDDFYSGSVPEGDSGFEMLAKLGVKTIISVDGAEPEVDAARARGMRYIHLPIGYNGFDEQRKLQLVRATRDAIVNGPVYLHCHHGKHRSAGAAATVAASLGWATPEAMIERMRVSGTAPSYKGLYACAAAAIVMTVAEIDAVPTDFPEISRPSGFVKSMVEIDEINEHLKAIEKAAWTVPRDHPDLVPVAEAGRMADLLRNVIDSDFTRAKPAEFAQMLEKNNLQVQVLEDMLAAEEKDAKKLTDQFKLIAASCKDCHVKYRD